MLDVSRIETYYGETQVLFGVTLQVRAGEVVSLLGPNGAGKTTTIRSILGLNAARSGVIRFQERDITRLQTHELAGLHDLSGKVAFVPGGYGGLGEAIAWGLAMNGARVVIAGRSRQKAAALADALVGQGFEAAAQAVDVTAVGEIRDATDFVMQRFDRLDILVNCVGIQREEPLLEVTEEAFDDVYRVNLKAAMFLAQACARHQVANQSGGKQIHLLSVRAQLGLQNRGYSAYCSTKGGVALMS